MKHDVTIDTIKVKVVASLMSCDGYLGFFVTVCDGYLGFSVTVCDGYWGSLTRSVMGIRVLCHGL